MDYSLLREDAKQNNIPTLRDQSSLFLAKIIKEKNPKTILEFGTAVGLSAINMLTNSSATIETIELDKERASQAEINLKKFGFDKRAKVYVGDALAISNEFVKENKKFDFIFLDSAKGQYIKLLPNIIKLLNVNGTLVADNVLFRGYVNSTNFPRRFKTIVTRLREFNNEVINSKEFYDAKIVEIEDGIMIATKR
ncbi:MAG: O-methyltransferase [bacterium]|nr:O-methyltransferase [bacterium]